MPSNNAKARPLSATPKVDKPTLRKMIMARDIEGVRRLLPSKTAPRHRERAVSLAVSCANEDILRLLLENRAPGDNYDAALLNAVAANPPIEMFRLVLSLANPQVKNNLPIIRAAALGRIEILRELIPVSNVQVDNGAPLRYAAERGQIDALEILMPITDNLKAIVRKHGKKFEQAAMAMIQSKLDEDALRGKSKLKTTPTEPKGPSATRQRRPM